MGRDVLIVASGDTERRALPHLTKHLVGAAVRSLVDVRISPHGVLTSRVAEQIIRAAWWDLHGRGLTFDKAVVLVDADTQPPDEKLREFDDLIDRLASLPLKIKVAVAKWHLEAWFFADSVGLRAWFEGRSLGIVEPLPDAIQWPKQRLRNLLLPESYTPRVAASIASKLSVEAMRESSASFAAFESAVKNGESDR
jgi:hypothetical protein